MSVIEAGDEWLLLDGSSLITHETLPARTYKVRASMMGLKLVSADEEFVISDNEEIFGGREDKVEMIKKTYDASETSVGVLLSGKKGIGKTLFARMLATEAIKMGMPVVLIDHKSGGSNIVDLVASLPENVMVMFDEFEKVFDKDAQEELLGMFDGTSSKKRMFVITLNTIGRTSQFLLDRPGRFLFHLRFDSPSDEQIEEFLTTKVADLAEEDLIASKNLASVMDINYDILNALARMLNLGYHVGEVLADLNIASADGADVRYDIKLDLINSKTSKIVHTENQTDNLSLMKFLLGQARYYASVNGADAYIEHLRQLPNGRILGEVSLRPQDVYDGWVQNYDPDNFNAEKGELIDDSIYELHVEFTRAVANYGYSPYGYAPAEVKETDSNNSGHSIQSVQVEGLSEIAFK